MSVPTAFLPVIPPRAAARSMICRTEPCGTYCTDSVWVSRLCLSFNVLSNGSGIQLPADCLFNGGLYRLVFKRGDLSRSTGDECGQASAEVEVLVIELDCKHPYVFVPNVFSPNSDGMNDILFVKSNIVDQMNFSAYNRWGEKVFETHDFTTGWDSYLNGEALPSGVFAYILTGRCLNGKEILQKGNITLLR